MLRRFLGVALTTILLASSAAWAGSNLQRLGAPAPFWVLRSQGTPANVDFDFANGRYYQKNAVPGAGVSNLVTITRASTKYCENTSGLFGSVGNAVLCVTNKGALIEEARTNDALWARDMTNAAWVKTTMTAALTATGVDGTANAASTLTATAGNATALQTITLGSQADTYSFFVKRVTGTGTINITDDNGTGWTALDNTNCTQVGTGTGAAPSSSFWVRCAKTQTLANPVFGIRIVTNADAIAVDFNQLEPGSFVSSPILTTTAAATRAADVARVKVPPTFLTAYSAVGSGTPGAPTSYATAQTLMQIDDGSANNRLLIYRANSGGGVGTINTSGGSATSLGTQVWAQSAFGKLGASTIGGAQITIFNGASNGAGGAGNLPVGVANIRLGSNSGGASLWNGTISRAAVWSAVNLPTSALVQNTSGGP